MAIKVVLFLFFASLVCFGAGIAHALSKHSTVFTLRTWKEWRKEVSQKKRGGKKKPKEEDMVYLGFDLSASYFFVAGLVLLLIAAATGLFQILIRI